MNPELPQPQNHQHRRLTSCHRHPDQHVTGFCASCLRERLAGLDPATNNPSSSSASSSIFKASRDTALTNFRNKATVIAAANAAALASGSAGVSLLLPELRRSKSFSGGRGERFSGVVEPQRKSCDVRVRNTLSSLFNLDDDERNGGTCRETWGEIEIETRNLGLGFSGVGAPVLESREEDADEDEEKKQNGAETRVSDNVVGPAPAPASAPAVPHANLVVEEEEQETLGEMKTMKDYIDLESQSRKPSGRDLKDIAGSFLLAASIFSKKLHKWTRKQKMKKRANGGGESAVAMPAKKAVGKQFRETQSEIADYGCGRRSCDTDPRFSLDAGRMSFDDPRYSWDEPRASWDGYLIGRMFPRVPQMVSVVENVPVPVVRRSDNQIPVEEQPLPPLPMNSINENETVPGGSAQTRDYYSDSSSSHRRRKSLDRSTSSRKTAALVTEAEEMKPVSNAKVTPATIDYFHGAKVLVTDKDLRDSKSSSLRDDCSESFESAFRDSASVMSGNGGRKDSKKSRGWSKGWNLFGFIHRRSGSKNDTEERYFRGNVVERSFSESWPEFRTDGDGEVKGAFNRKAFRSNSSVNSRNSSNMGGGLFGNLRSSETNGHSRKRREGFVLERNRSARYSPSNLDNGLLRFYLTPLRGSRRSSSGKSRPKTSHSIARSVLRFY